MSCGSRLQNGILEIGVDGALQVTQSKYTSLHRRGSAVFEYGQYPHGVYCINHGHVKIVRPGGDGRDHIIRFAKAGDIVGYSSLLTNERYAISCIAVDDSIVCSIPAPLLFHHIQHNPRLALHVMQRLSAEVQGSQRRIVELAHKTIRERVAEALLVLKEVFGTGDDGATLASPLTRDEIASVVGTAPESVIRTLSDFKADKLITITGRSIKLDNPAGLARIANIQD
jgi:CRP/FNR family transcriptional regulator